MVDRSMSKTNIRDRDFELGRPEEGRKVGRVGAGESQGSRETKVLIHSFIQYLGAIRLSRRTIDALWRNVDLRAVKIGKPKRRGESS